MIPLPSLTMLMDGHGRLVLHAGGERAVWPALGSATVEKETRRRFPSTPESRRMVAEIMDATREAVS